MGLTNVAVQAMWVSFYQYEYFEKNKIHYLFIIRSKPGNILTRRLYRNKRQNNDNELYRSNSFKFERFERKEDIDNTTDVERRKVISLYRMS